MSADRGRITHHPPRKYREVVSQQGRVLLDADANEGQRIFTEETRCEALDFVGPCGTPDDGYEVVPSGLSFQTTPGTMYVGGLRVTQETPVHYEKQPDWLDTDAIAPWGDGLWRDPVLFQKLGTQATLVLREQEITAVEDPALRDVALGGPDSCARTRLLQRLVAIDTKSITCEAASAAAIGFWSDHGLEYDLHTAGLTPRARLQVTPVTNPPSPSPCDPPSASGYLGADNQMLRVMVTSLDANTTQGTLLWGYYNASTLYRATVQSATTVKLATRPVSAEYQPRTGQVVQILLRAANLGEGAFAAALTGHFAKLTAPYAPDTQIVTLPAAMPQPPHGNGTNVYLRLWEDQVSFTAGTPVVLAGTGLQVTITKASAGPLHIGDYWLIAVRPLTPNVVYPERLLDTPQPPDGPRMWACPLAVLGAGGKPLKVLDDCRLPFDNLVELTARTFEGDSCACTVCVSPQDHAKGAPSLQEAISMVLKAGGGTLCLEPGEYRLEKPLQIVKAASIAIVGKHQASVLLPRQTAIEVRDSADILLQAFAINYEGNAAAEAILVASSTGVRVERLRIAANVDKGNVISLSGALTDIALTDNRFSGAVGVADLPQGNQAVGLDGLRIEDNAIECTAAGIRLQQTVHQHVTRIAGNHIRGCKEGGIEVTGASASDYGIEVVDNELEVLGHGITAGVHRLRAAGNDITLREVTDPELCGIRIVQGLEGKALDRVQITGNRVTRYPNGIASDMEVGSVLLTGNQIAGSRIGLRIRAMFDVLNIGQNQIMDVDGVAVQVESKVGRAITTGNRFQIRSPGGNVPFPPGVQILCHDGDCTFTDNHVQFMSPFDGDGILLRGRAVIVTSNRVTGRVRMHVATSMGPLKQGVCTVVGNIVGLNIVLTVAASPTGPLPAPWAALNIENVP